MLRRIALALLLLIAAASPLAAKAGHASRAVTILISIDGFRPDYRARGVTPNLDALASQGVSAAMRPVFPSKTFPNHWTMVTGLRPDRHGIVANRMIDPEGKRPPFALASEDPWWWQGGEPVWLAAERAGIRAATEFWPGSTVEGMRASDFNRYDATVPAAKRVDVVLDWLKRPVATRPRLVTLYFEAVDSTGHAFGPDSPEVTKAVADVDAAIGRLREGLAALGQRANIVVVSDHGIAAISAERVVVLASFASADDYTVVEDGPFAALNAVPAREQALASALTHAPEHVRCWPRAKVPARLHYSDNPRIPQFLCLADPGWMLLARVPTTPVRGGNHGYDNDAPDMRALFIAAGPSFRPAGKLRDFDNLAIEPLVRRLIGLPPGKQRDGSIGPLRKVLRNR